MDFDQFILAETPEFDEYLIGTYLFRTDDPDILKRVTAAATDQTTGTWVKLPGETRDMLRKHRGRVLNIWEIPDIELAKAREDGRRQYIFQIAFPWQNFGGQIPMLFTTAYGKFGLTYEKYMRILIGLRNPLYDKNRAFPVIGGEVRPGSLPQVFNDAGTDCVVAAGGAIYAHPMGPTAGATAFRQGIDLMMRQGSFDGAENDYPESR